MSFGKLTTHGKYSEQNWSTQCRQCSMRTRDAETQGKEGRFRLWLSWVIAQSNLLKPFAVGEDNETLVKLSLFGYVKLSLSSGSARLATARYPVSRTSRSAETAGERSCCWTNDSNGNEIVLARRKLLEYNHNSTYD